MLLSGQFEENAKEVYKERGGRKKVRNESSVHTLDNESLGSKSVSLLRLRALTCSTHRLK